jgi:hypothetical protein
MKAFLKGIIALAPIVCITPIFFSLPDISYKQSTLKLNEPITNLNIMVELAKNPYIYIMPAIDDTTTILQFKQLIVADVYTSRSIDLKIKELNVYYQHTIHDSVTFLMDDNQTLTTYGVQNDGNITVIINGNNGISDL